MINLPMEQYLNRHEALLKEILLSRDIPAATLKDAMLYSLFPGGKRLRPLLVYLTGEILAVDLQSLDLIAAAIELTHCYSLIHDDLPAMDNDDYRRGKLSCHKAFSEATAILSGDALQALALSVLLERLPHYLSAEQVIALAKELLNASGVSGMISGQSLDLTDLSNSSIQESQLAAIHNLKTGKLISACFTMVLIAARRSSVEVTQAFSSYGQRLGLVFQMQDDYLDCYAGKKLGKKEASDTRNQKATFATLYSKNELENLIHNHFKDAKAALGSLGSRANALLMLTESLEQRSLSA